ncbi:MAG: hypothetical protein GKR92_04830 [Gammaproteobacteria bacterium]|nr:MAG: hypothetical protein GKR92_04830 [Gammaproteobacteria bacterium]
MTYDHDPKTFDLRQRLAATEERVGTYQGLCSASMNKIHKLEARIGRLKAAQRRAHLPFKGSIE